MNCMLPHKSYTQCLLHAPSQPQEPAGLPLLRRQLVWLRALRALMLGEINSHVPHQAQRDKVKRALDAAVEVGSRPQGTHCGGGSP
jgi:hypothetical protein